VRLPFFLLIGTFVEVEPSLEQKAPELGLEDLILAPQVAVMIWETTTKSLLVYSKYCLLKYILLGILTTLLRHNWPLSVTALQMKGRWKSNINVWFPFIYSQKWNYYFQNRIIMFCLPVPALIYMWEIYIFPGVVCLFCCREICGLILGIYKWLTDTWMWKLGLRPLNSQERNTYVEFSLQCVTPDMLFWVLFIAFNPKIYWKPWLVYYPISDKRVLLYPATLPIFRRRKLEGLTGILSQNWPIGSH
jgi:hypothetical protein